MNSRVLYIGNQRVDLPDSVNFNLVWQIADPGELKIYGSGSSTIKLPFTPTNDSVFGNCKHLTIVGGREFDTFYDCRYYERGRLMIENGTAFLVSVSDGYDICLTWGNSDLVHELKDTPLYDKSIGAFKWDNSEIYPLAETSEAPNEYPAFYNKNGSFRIRPALTRPIVKYTDVLAVAGITSSNIPSWIYNFLKYCYLQVTGTQAVGYYTDAVAIDNADEPVDVGVGLDGVVYDDWLYYINAARIGQIAVANNGTYQVNLAAGYLGESGYTLYGVNEHYEDFSSFCFFLVENDYGASFMVGRDNFITNVFANDDVTAYEGTYRCISNPNATGHILKEAIVPVALAYVSNLDYPVPLMACASNFGSELVGLQNKNYYIYVCPRKTRYKYNTGNYNENNDPIFQRSFDGTVGVETGISIRETTNQDNATKVESPDDEILKTDPPDKITMLGYSTAAEIAEDFLTLFPLMCQPEKTADGFRLRYFGFNEVIANIPNAYDFSKAFVKLEKIEFGNDNVALRNRVRFASYGDYDGFRADGEFSTVSLQKVEKDYGTLKQIANYDYMRQFQLTDKIEIGQYSLAKVNEKDGVYSAGGINSVPPVFFVFKGDRRTAIDDNSVRYTVYYNLNKEDNTLQHIIGGEGEDTGYWEYFLKVIRRQKTVTVKLNIDPGDLIDFDFRRPVYIKQISVYVFAQKITYKGDGVAELKGIVLPSSAQGTPKPVYEDGMLVDSTDTYVVDSTDTYIVEQ